MRTTAQILANIRNNVLGEIMQQLEKKDAYTYKHCLRVATMSYFMCETLNLSESETITTVISAFLHDVGKLNIPDNILKGTGKLTNEEWQIMRTHPQQSAEILSAYIKDEDVLDNVLHHHERINGSGYPHGLKNNSLNISIRIIGLMDSIDAMLTKRSYKLEMPDEVVIEELTKNKNSLFDSQLVDIVLSNWDFFKRTCQG